MCTPGTGISLASGATVVGFTLFHSYKEERQKSSFEISLM